MNATINLLDKVYELNISRVQSIIQIHKGTSNDAERDHLNAYVVCVLEGLKGKMIVDHIDVVSALSGKKK